MDFVVVFVQVLSPVLLFATPGTAARQASLSFTISEFAQTHVHWVDNAIQLSYSLLPPSVLCGTWDSSSPTRDSSCSPCIGSVLSQPLVHWESPMGVFGLFVCFLIFLIGGKLHFNAVLASAAPYGSSKLTHMPLTCLHAAEQLHHSVSLSLDSCFCPGLSNSPDSANVFLDFFVFHLKSSCSAAHMDRSLW